MASMFKSQTVTYRGADGRRCRKGDPGAVPFKVFSAAWYGRFKGPDGKPKTVALCRDKQASKAMLARLEADAGLRRAGLVDPRADRLRTHEAGGLAGHLAAFEAMLVAKNGTSKYASVTTNRARRIVDLAGFRSVSDLTAAGALDALARLRAEGLGAETINHHVRAIKGFARWLWKEGRAREHHLAHLATSSSEGDRRRRRRALSHDEATRLVAAAKAGPEVMGMAGLDRARLYELAMGTGLRAAELASLTPERFDLAGDPPTATCPGGYTKNGKEAIQPIPAGLAARLAPWVASLLPNKPVFKLPGRTAEMIRVDLAAAGVPYETPAGVVDFHSLRGVYITNLVASGASVKTCQILARHSTAALTIGIYAKASFQDLKGAVAGLPDLSGPAPAPAKAHRKRWAGG